MRRIIIAGAISTCTLAGFGACGGQVAIGGAEPGDGGMEAGEKQLDAGSTTDATSPATNGEAGLTAGQTAAVAADVYPILPGGEATLCQIFSNPFGGDVDLVSIEATTDAHDVFLFSLPPSGASPAPAPTALMGCLYDPLGAQPFLYFADRPDVAITYPQPNMGYPLSRANSLMLRVHYLNTGATMARLQTKLSLGAAAAGLVTTHVGAIFLSHGGFPVDSTDDGGPFTAESSTSPLDGGYSIFTSWSFAQPAKAEVRASTNGVVFYDVTNSLIFSELLQHNPPVQIGAAASLDWSCTYPGDDLAQSGNCIYQGYYYPADPKNPDLNLRF
jgi:hypothetical protein